jgi:hypothetical protein
MRQVKQDHVSTITVHHASMQDYLLNTPLSQQISLHLPRSHSLLVFDPYWITPTTTGRGSSFT